MGILYPRGMSLGGSSQINAMNFVYPPDSDWTHIAELTADGSWSPENMREHFVAYENNTYLPLDTPGHGFDGYIEVGSSE
jgi:choline dehydrogenase